MATSLSAIGPSISTEVNFAILQERAASLRTSTQLAHRAVNEAYQDKNAAEEREKEQSRRIDKLIEQLAEAGKRQTPEPPVTPTPNPGPDINVMFTKYLQAQQNYTEEQSKVVHRDGVLHQKSLEIIALQDKLKNLRTEQSCSHSNILNLEEKIRDLQANVDAAAKSNTDLKDQLRDFKIASNEAAKVPVLIKDLAARDTELNKLRPKADKVTQLDQQLNFKDEELKKLRSEAVKVPELTQKLRDMDAELVKLRPEASKVSKLNQKLVDWDAEIVKLRPQASQVPELMSRIAAQDSDIQELRAEVLKWSDLAAQMASKEAELEDLRPKAAEASVLAEKSASQEAELVELRSKATQFDGKVSQNLVFQSDIHGYKNTIQTLKQQLETLNKLQKENAALQSEAKESQKTITSLQNELQTTEQSAKQVDVLQKELSMLTVNWGDYDQLKKRLESQTEIQKQQVTQIGHLEGKLENAKKVTSQVPTLQAQVQQWSQKCVTLNQELIEARKAVEKCQVLQADVLEKEKDLSELRKKVQKMDEISNQLQSAQEYSQQKSAQVATLQAQANQLQVDPPKVAALQQPQTQVVDEKNFPTQQIMLEQAEQANTPKTPAATLRSAHFQTTHPDMPTRKKADRTAAGTRYNHRGVGLPYGHASKLRSSHKGMNKSTQEIDDTQKIPDSQPQAEVQKLLATSSPLSDLETAELFGHRFGNAQRDLPGNLPPSSSHGGDAMLLEDFEDIENMIAVSQIDAVEIPQSQRQTQKYHGYGHASSRTIVTKSGTTPGVRRLRTTLSSQVIEDSQSQEQRLSTPKKIPSSPAGVAKHLPNSAAKRPRLDPIESTQSTQSTQTTSKRLKRTPANLEVRKTPKRPDSSGTQVTEPDSTRADPVKLPSGSRKGSVIGANAPAPGKAQGSRRQTRKGSKTDRYAQRFNQE